MSTAGQQPKLVVAISSRALFDLSESHEVFEKQGIAAYCDYQIAHEDDLLKQGVAFPLVKKLLALNDLFLDQVKVEVVLMSRNSADTGLRIFNSIRHFKLNITRAVFTGGSSPFGYARALGAHLFLSANAGDVSRALQAGMAAATILGEASSENKYPDQLRIAFDGDSVLFSDEAEQVYQQKGLAAFESSELRAAKKPLSGGPFKPFLAVLHQIQSLVGTGEQPIRTALFTARGAPAHERVIRTLRAWNIRIDEALFLAGMDKSSFLADFGADIFFDDQQGHCEAASKVVPTGHVPHGIANP